MDFPLGLPGTEVLQVTVGQLGPVGRVEVAHVEGEDARFGHGLAERRGRLVGRAEALDQLLQPALDLV